MARPRKDLSDQRLNRIAIYLTDSEEQLLQEKSVKTGVPPAILVRTLFLKEFQTTNNLFTSGESVHFSRAYC